MYKVFINEKELRFQERADELVRSIPYEGTSTLEMAVDLLQNTSTTAVAVYTEEVAEMWQAFTAMYRVVEAAGGIIFNKEEKILFIFRLGRWDLPKGKIEKGESPDTAALREVAEEVGLEDVTLENFFTNTYHVYRERNGQHVLKKTHWYRMRQTGDSVPTPQVEEGITKVEWKDVESISAEVLPTTFQNIKIILTALL